MLYGNKPANLRHFRLFFLHNTLSTTAFYPLDNSSGLGSSSHAGRDIFSCCHQEIAVS
jgi:hypothetical protein